MYSCQPCVLVSVKPKIGCSEQKHHKHLEASRFSQTQRTDRLALQKASSSLKSPETDASLKVSFKILRDAHPRQLIECKRCPFINV